MFKYITYYSTANIGITNKYKHIIHSEKRCSLDNYVLNIHNL